MDTTKTYIEVEAPPFLDRMELDTNSRRKTKFINELSESRHHCHPTLSARAHRPDPSRGLRREAPGVQAQHARGAQGARQPRA